MGRRRQAALLAILFLAILYVVIKVATYHQENKTVPRIWLLKCNGTIGIYINQTIWQLAEQNRGLLEGDPQQLSTALCLTIFNKLAYVKTPFDAGSYLTKTNSSSTIYLINPTKRNKWVMKNTSNAFHYGFDLSKAEVIKQQLVELFPTEYYF